MYADLHIDEAAGASPVSTSRLPHADLVQAVVNEAHQRYRSVTQGAVANYIPALARTPAKLFGLCDWLYEIGLPGKSGVSGGIVTLSPGKGGMGTFAPLLDEAGNSIKGQLATRFLSERLGLNLFASQPVYADRRPVD